MLDELSFTNLDSRKKNRESCGNTLSRHFSVSSISLFFSLFPFLVDILNEDPLQQLYFSKLITFTWLKRTIHFRIRVVTIDYRYFIDIDTFRYIDNISIEVNEVSIFSYWKLLLRSKNIITCNKLQ